MIPGGREIKSTHCAFLHNAFILGWYRNSCRLGQTQYQPQKHFIMPKTEYVYRGISFSIVKDMNQWLFIIAGFRSEFFYAKFVAKAEARRYIDRVFFNT